MKVPLLDLRAQHASIRAEVAMAVSEVLDSQHFILGPRVRECEEAVAAYCRCAHAVGVSSGTDALLIALMAEEIGPGDEVITTPYTFFATAGVIARVGARPVFVDIRPDTFNLDPEQIRATITERTRAIVPVHLYGQMADMPPILECARRNGLTVIEDAAQSIGAEAAGGRAGSVGDYGCFSFYPSKNLGAAGDGGMVSTQDAARSDRLRWLRVHGAEPKYYHRMIGGNFRLDAIQAAVVLAKLRHLDDWTRRRQDNAARYDRLFTESGLVEAGAVALPSVVTPRHVFNQYVIRTGRRDELRRSLEGREVGTEVYYPVPLHRQECFAYLGYGEGAFPEAERAARESLALPIYPELTAEQACYVVQCVRDFFAREGSR